jgi:hypothetical protein
MREKEKGRMQYKFGMSKRKPIFHTCHLKIVLKSTTKIEAQVNKQNLEAQLVHI